MNCCVGHPLPTTSGPVSLPHPSPLLTSSRPCLPLHWPTSPTTYIFKTLSPPPPPPPYIFKTLSLPPPPPLTSSRPCPPPPPLLHLQDPVSPPTGYPLPLLTSSRPCLPLPLLTSSRPCPPPLPLLTSSRPCPPPYIFKTLSLPPLATLSPSGLQSTEKTSSAWPGRSTRRFLVFISHTCSYKELFIHTGNG